MARINIEDCWWTDPRRSLLAKKVGSEEMADAVIIRAWRLAQEFWKADQGLIPVELFETLPHFQDVIDSRLADVRGRSVYVRGSSAYLDWVREQREQARAAGKKSAESRKAKSGTAQPQGGKGSKKGKKSERQPNDNRTESNGTEPSVSDSVSVSVSDSGSNSDSVVISSASKSAEAIRAETWVSYRDAYLERWKSEPERNAQVNSQIKMLVERVGENAIPLVRFYVGHNNTFYIGKGHPIGLCVSDYQGLMTQMKRGQQITNADLRELEKTQQQVSKMQQLRKVNL